MADSKRLTMLKALSDYLVEEIREAKGYKHNLNGEGQVSRGRLIFGKGDPVPSIAILENIDPDRFPRQAGGDYEHVTGRENWTLLFQGWVKDDKLNPTDPAYELMADLRKALAKLVKRATPMTAEVESPDYLLGGLIAGMTMEPGIARPPTEGISEKAFFWMRVAFVFVEDPNDPYLLT